MQQDFPRIAPNGGSKYVLGTAALRHCPKCKAKVAKDAQTRRNPRGLDSLRSANFPADLWLVRSTVPIPVSSGLSTRRGAFL